MQQRLVDIASRRSTTECAQILNLVLLLFDESCSRPTLEALSIALCVRSNHIFAAHATLDDKPPNVVTLDRNLRESGTVRFHDFAHTCIPVSTSVTHLHVLEFGKFSFIHFSCQHVSQKLRNYVDSTRLN